MAKQKKMDSYCVADAITMGLGGIEELRDELQDWYDNMPESTQGGEKGDTLQTSIEALSNFENLDVPECVSEAAPDVDDDDEMPGKNPYVGGLRFELQDMTKRRMSRAMRRDVNVALLSAALDTIRQAVDEHEEGAEDDPYAETRDDITTFCDELENAISEFEGAEFPGMYG